MKLHAVLFHGAKLSDKAAKALRKQFELAEELEELRRKNPDIKSTPHTIDDLRRYCR